MYLKQTLTNAQDIRAHRQIGRSRVYHNIRPAVWLLAGIRCSGYTFTLTAFTTSFGLYQFTVMPFGLYSAPTTRQRMMDALLNEIEKVAAYLDAYQSLG